MEGKQYVIGCTSNNWYDARIYCEGLGGDLAIMDTQNKINTVLEYVAHRGLYDKCGWLFIGLRKEEWMADTSDGGNITCIMLILNNNNIYDRKLNRVVLFT